MRPLRPFFVLQWFAAGIEPLHIVVTRLPPAILGQRGNALAQMDQCSGEIDQAVIAFLPVKPTERVVLTISVVVSVLAVAALIASQQHRCALRQQQRGE